MAGYNTIELEDIHRLLPFEILEDIGIASTDESRTMEVIEELASRLSVVLGNAMGKGQYHALPPTRAASFHEPHVRGPSGRGRIPGGSNRQRVLEGARPFLGNGRTLDVPLFLPRFAPAWPPLAMHVVPPVMLGGSGTGVFLPCTVAAHHHARRNTKPSRSDAHADSRYSKQQCRQQQRLRSGQKEASLRS